MTKANQLAEKIFKNWPAKILCFICAVFLYMFHQSVMVEKRSFVIPLEIVQDGIVMPVGDYTKNVTVIVRANTEEITSVHTSQIKAYVNLNNITKSGEYSLPVNISLAEELMVYDPFEIKVKPESVKINVEKKASKFISVKPSIVGEPAHGYKVSDIKIEPSYIEIAGPESMLMEIDELGTDVIDINKATTKQFARVSGFELSKIIELKDENEYNVEIIIEPVVMEKKFEGFKIQPISLSEDFELMNTLPTANLVLQGIVPMLETFNLNAYSVQVDLSSIKEEGTYELPVKYVFPSYFKLIRKSVDKVTVDIKKIVKEENTEEENLLENNTQENNTQENIEKPEIKQ